MGFIEFFYTQLVNYFQSVQETQFGAVAASLATTGQLLATLVVIFVLLAAVSGRSGLSAGDVIKLVITVVFVALFMRNWTEFNSLVAALTSFFDGLRDSFFAGVVAGGEAGFLRALDDTMKDALAAATTAAGALDIVGAVQNGIVLLFFSMLSAFCLLAMVFSYAMLTIGICFAPVAIMCVLSEKTKNYFEKWMDFMVAALLFPVVIAAILGTTIAMMQQAFSLNAGDPTIGIFFPVMAAVLTSIIMIAMSPFVVLSLTGSFSLARVAAAGGVAIGAGASRALSQSARTIKSVGETTGSYFSTQMSQGNAPYANANRASAIQRQVERTQRLGNRNR